jgi:hypothetical protein
LPVDSGTVERAWQHLVSAWLTLAGMPWDVPGAEAVAVVRAWLKSGRWNDALRLRPPPATGVGRQQPRQPANACLDPRLKRLNSGHCPFLKLCSRASTGGDVGVARWLNR